MFAANPLEPPAPSARDDSLTLLFLCCHPALTPVSQVALTLRAVGGLTTAEIARALLVPESTVAQRISRAKARINDSGARFAVPAARRCPSGSPRCCTCSTWSSTRATRRARAPTLQRVELSTEAIRLTRQLHATRLPDRRARSPGCWR